MRITKRLSRAVKIDDELTLHVESAGTEKQAVMLVPSWAMTTEVFSRQLSYFEDHPHYRFITYDPRSHGRSTDTPGGHYYEQHGRDLHALVETLELDDFVLGGWSFGVLDVLSYVDQFGSGKLSGLIMLDGSPKSRGTNNTEEWVSYRYDDADGREEFFTIGPLRDRAGTNEEFAKWMLEETSRANMEWVAGITNQTRDEVAALLNAAGAFLDYSDVLIELNDVVPLLYVVSEAVKAPVQQWSRQNTPKAQVIARGKHLMFWERAAEFNAGLEQFLESVHR